MVKLTGQAMQPCVCACNTVVYLDGKPDAATVKVAQKNSLRMNERVAAFSIQPSMVTRFMALRFSFCIGVPMCWCCVEEAGREGSAGCCSTVHRVQGTAQQPQPPHSKFGLS